MFNLELDEKEAHCVARLLQGAFYGKNVLVGCTFCKYQCLASVISENSVSMQSKIREKFMAETGVDLTSVISCDVVFSEFPYKKFLKNSNETVKRHFREVFEYLTQST